jgi:branched-chain amino acid transport system ATP-binding protein
MALLETRDLSKHFGGLKALDAIDFSIEPGEIVGLIGPNGAGKTTFFNCITGLYPPTRGSIRFQGHSIAKLRPDQVTRAGVARTFQNIRLFQEMSCLDNVMVGRHCRTLAGVLGAVLRTWQTRREEREIEKKSRELLDFVGLSQQAEEISKNLPYGSQRRLEMARALATDPVLLFLDEPAAGMNPQEVSDLMALIHKIRARSVTIILIEHHMRVVMGICERIVVLNYGLKIAEGKPEDVQRDDRVIEAYLGQSGGIRPC